MPRELIPKLSHREILSYEEILRVVRVGAALGISKIRITGGEPLVRKGVYRFLSQLTRMEGLQDISLTTNAVLLKDNISKRSVRRVFSVCISISIRKSWKYFFEQRSLCI